MRQRFVGGVDANVAAHGERDRFFRLLVPLVAARPDRSDLVGVLALGPRLSGQGYAGEDRSLLAGLAACRWNCAVKVSRS